MFKEKAARWNADKEIQSILTEIQQPSIDSPKLGRFSAKNSNTLLAYDFDKDAMMTKCLPYERLDQLTVDILLGTR